MFINFNENNYRDINTNISKNDYYFMLNIPKIDLSKKVYNYNNKKNDVDKGIYLVKDYDLSSLEGSLILASHSGNSSISHFKNLHLLKEDDFVFIIYNDKSYVYQIDKIYKINKNGKFYYTDKDKQIFLITCDKKDKKKQLVFRGKLIKIVKKSTFF